VVRTVGQVGGGAMPLAAPESWACALAGGEPQGMQERLRGAEPPVIARIADGKLLLDVRCLTEEELEPVARAVQTLQEA